MHTAKHLTICVSIVADEAANACIQVVDSFSSKSFRLMAMAVGIIPNTQALELTQMTQQQIESAASDLELLSLVVLANSIRQDSKDTISELQDRFVLQASFSLLRDN